MFCPSCGVQSQTHQRFCKSCGTDLSLVSSALSSRDGFSSTRPDINQSGQAIDVIELNKQLARGYKDAVTGGGILLAIFVVVALMHERWAFWIVLWLLVWGCSSFAKGIGNIITARQIMNRFTSQTSLPQQPVMPRVQTNPIPYIPPQDKPSAPDYGQPDSVTEHTTRKLENVDSSAVEH